MGKRRSANELGRRERQILDIVYRLGEAAVGEVLEQMSDPPAYDSVRTMLRLLEHKGFVSHRKDGTKYVYRPTQSRFDGQSVGAFQHLMKTFFEKTRWRIRWLLRLSCSLTNSPRRTFCDWSRSFPKLERKVGNVPNIFL